MQEGGGGRGEFDLKRGCGVSLLLLSVQQLNMSRANALRQAHAMNAQSDDKGSCAVQGAGVQRCQHYSERVLLLEGCLAA